MSKALFPTRQDLEILFYRLFSILSTSRWQLNASGQNWRRALKARGVGTDPRLSLWVSLVRAARLLDSSSPPRPTMRMRDWFSLTEAERLRDLARHWPLAAQSTVIKSARKRILEQLNRRQTEGLLLDTYRTDLAGLQAMLLWQDRGLTWLGRQILTGEVGAENWTSPPRAWRLEGQRLVVPLPADWGLLWRLEAYLNNEGVHTEEQAACYPLDERAMRRAAARGGADKLAEILEVGLGSRLPPDLTEIVRDRPAVRFFEGGVLEFSDPADLQRLRDQPNLRQVLLNQLTRRHIFIEPGFIQVAVERLVHRGLLPTEELDERQPAGQKPGLSLSESQRAEILCQAWVLESLLPDGGLEPRLLKVLQRGMPEALIRSARRQARLLVQKLEPESGVVEEADPRPVPDPDIIRWIEQAIDREEPVEFYYKKTDARDYEHRRVTPLALLLYGPRPKLMGYCHTRKAQRTFRLDRMQIDPEMVHAALARRGLGSFE